ncbi:MAG: SagB/ThcOx family dehydrogenase [Anaerolineales bacterium]|nr:SagB/ThcOx family dehydrogenase [Anaerolineales bacterium]
MGIKHLPDFDRNNPLNALLLKRCSVRSFLPKSLDSQQVSDLLWSCQGMTRGDHRTAPSAGARYPLEIYWVDREQTGHYDVDHHRLEILLEEDLRTELSRAALDQQFIAEAPATVVITAVFHRVAGKYGVERGARYVQMEVGHAAQNVLLQAAALGLGSVPVGAFDDDQVSRLLRLPEDHAPLYLLPIGHPTAPPAAL